MWSDNKTHQQQQAFPKLTETQIEKLADFAELQSFSDGDALFEAGETDFKFYVVKSGAVEIIERSDGNRKQVTVHKAGEFTGDIDTLTGSPSLVTAIAQGNCEAYAILAEDLRRIVKERPQLSDIILNAFLMRRELLKAEGFRGIKIIGSRFSQDTKRIRDMLTKNKIPFTWLDLEKEQKVEQMLEQFQIELDDTPVVVIGQDELLKNPSNAVLGEALGIKKELGEADKLYDLTVVGAGPAGLAAAVYGASEGLDTIVLEETAPGGQAGSSSKIENYLGFPTGLSVEELANRAVTQAKKFGATISTASKVVDQEFEHSYPVIHLEGGETITSRCLLVSTGASYRKLSVPGCKEFEGRGVYYSATNMETEMCVDSEIVIVGGGNSAGQVAVFLSEYASKVKMMIRGNDMVHSMSKYLVRRVDQTENIELMTQSEITEIHGNEAVNRVSIKNNANGETSQIDTQAVFIFIGAVPNTEWIAPEIATDENGFLKTGRDLPDDNSGPLNRQPFYLETSAPGVFAAGDVRAGSVKRVASAVGEGSMTVQFVHSLLAE
jgi:thioredoxin reductase (NADPH)